VTSLDNVDSVICEVRNGAGWIRLNRPRAINSLRADMVERMLDQLNRWKDDPDVALVCLEGEGEKGFCAGGDMRALYDLRNGGIEEYALRFFVAEYRMDHLIHRYPKPVAAFMNGVVMGGGVGLSIGASHRFVTDTTRWAMPEMNIGFFPDVGASYFLNRFPGFVGRYLALTSHTIGVGDTIYLNAADCAVEPDRWEALKREFAGRMWTADTAREDLKTLMRAYSRKETPPSPLSSLRQQIDRHFCLGTVEEIEASLREAANRGDEWARQTRETLLSKAPLSLKATLRLLQEGQSKTLHECLEMELNLSMNFMNCPDFFEGVRAVLVDKDRQPNWTFASLGQVADADVEALFACRWPDGDNPLRLDLTARQHSK